ncbi:hypothetical protein EVAR_7702_1 [Eumeta japonica]|uniref:Uncharacterized protein n=1 Tax=Eumeta variegata TaxID=151549 RepID=A0A4C1TID7_EUMVA|nr:hypothetical protein EVAR_7702_1 [Eumeta japonica]
MLSVEFRRHYYNEMRYRWKKSCTGAVSLLPKRIGRWSGREIARSALSLARSAQAERDNELCFFVRAAGVHRFIRRYHVNKLKCLLSELLVVQNRCYRRQTAWNNTIECGPVTCNDRHRASPALASRFYNRVCALY